MSKNKHRNADPVVASQPQGGADATQAEVAKPAKVSCMSLLKTYAVGDSVQVADIARASGNSNQSVVTSALACNSDAPSNKRFRATGMYWAHNKGTLTRVASAPVRAKKEKTEPAAS